MSDRARGYTRKKYRRNISNAAQNIASWESTVFVVSDRSETDLARRARARELSVIFFFFTEKYLIVKTRVRAFWNLASRGQLSKAIKTSSIVSTIALHRYYICNDFYDARVVFTGGNKEFHRNFRISRRFWYRHIAGTYVCWSGNYIRRRARSDCYISEIQIGKKRHGFSSWIFIHYN